MNPRKAAAVWIFVCLFFALLLRRKPREGKRRHLVKDPWPLDTFGVFFFGNIEKNTDVLEILKSWSSCNTRGMWSTWKRCCGQCTTGNLGPRLMGKMLQLVFFFNNHWGSGISVEYYPWNREDFQKFAWCRFSLLVAFLLVSVLFSAGPWRLCADFIWNGIQLSWLHACKHCVPTSTTWPRTRRPKDVWHKWLQLWSVVIGPRKWSTSPSNARA